MSDYDFKNINDKDFEQLCVDLLSREFQTRIERFKPGKDGGVDGRFFIKDKDEAVIQCKHWQKSGYGKLLAYLKKTELSKIKKLKPKRYILTTTVELSRKQKQDIADSLSPFILSESDIFGAEDINDLLKKYSDIEKAHFKLWISSAAVLEKVLHNDVHQRSKDMLGEYIEKSNVYVCTEDYDHALDKLNEFHTVILKGLPGIGKTTLAEQLCVYYTCKHDFEFVEIEDDIRDGERVFNERSKQVFLFDDFLGSNYLMAINNHTDSHIVKFINRIKKNKDKRFILTSRTNILNQGHLLSQAFRDNNLNCNEFELSIKTLSLLDKARILYNHIWFSNLDEEFVLEIYKQKRYIQIIKHKNFNPRIISYITDEEKLSNENITSKDYWGHILQVLNNPKDIWENVFTRQLKNEQRYLAYAVFLNGGQCIEPLLRKVYGLYAKGTVDFKDNIEALVNSVLTRSINGRKVIYDFFNPSVGDYILGVIINDFEFIYKIISCLGTAESLENLLALESFIREDRNESIKTLMEGLIDKFLDVNNNSYEFQFRLITWIFEDGNNPNWTQKALTFIDSIDLRILQVDTWDNILYSIHQSMCKGKLSSKKVFEADILQKALSSYSNSDIFIIVKEIIKILEQDGFCLNSEEFLDSLKEYLIYNFEEFLFDMDIDINLYTYQVGRDEDEQDFDEDSIYNKVYENIEDIIYSCNVEFEPDDIHEICEEFDVGNFIKENICDEDSAYEQYRDQKAEIEAEAQAESEKIDDLFMRA